MPDNVLAFTSIIVSSFLGKNQTSRTDLATLIQTVHSALTDAAAPPPEPAPPQEPAVSVRRSITSNAVLCMECGKPFKSLRRHLETSHDLSPGAYRAKWSLPKTYSMTAPAYSAARSVLAKSIGFGFRRDLPAETVVANAASATPVDPKIVEAKPAPKPKARARAATQPNSETASPKRSRKPKAE